MHIFFYVTKMAGFTKWRAFVLCLFCLFVNVERVSASAEIMKKLTQKFASVVDQCKNELKTPDHVMQDIMNFWREEYELVNSELGCLIMCMAAKFDLLTDGGAMHHGNAQEFAMSHGADESLAKQLVTIIHECEKQFEQETDDCARVLEIAKCFRTKIHELKWAPSIELVLEEIMSDM